MSPDLFNGLLQVVGVVFILRSILRLRRDKMVRGVSWDHVAYFNAWGFWNLFYYLSLGQWFSFVGGVGIVIVNSVWLAMLLYYSRNEGARSEPPRAPRTETAFRQDLQD